MKKTEDAHKYDDMIQLPHHVSSRRARMSMVDRGAQFSPFAALVGYDAAIEETARLTDRAIELDEGGKALLDERLRMVMELPQAHPEITLTYFRPDLYKAGGEYVRFTGRVKKIDGYTRAILFTDGMSIPLDCVIAIDSDDF